MLPGTPPSQVYLIHSFWVPCFSRLLYCFPASPIGPSLLASSQVFCSPCLLASFIVFVSLKYSMYCTYLASKYSAFFASVLQPQIQSMYIPILHNPPPISVRQEYGISLALKYLPFQIYIQKDPHHFDGSDPYPQHSSWNKFRSDQCSEITNLLEKNPTNTTSESVKLRRLYRHHCHTCHKTGLVNFTTQYGSRMHISKTEKRDPDVKPQKMAGSAVLRPFLVF